MKTNRLEVMRAYTLVCLPVAALFWLIFAVGAVFPAEVIRDGWIVLAVITGIVL